MSKLNDADLILNLQMSILKKLDAEDYVTSIVREGDSLLIVTKNKNVTKIELPKGEKGEKGDNGRRGGKDGIDGKDGAPGADGKDGKNGLPGTNGKNGKDGNGIIDIKIDQRGHLIIITRDKTYDLGRIRSGGGGTVIKTQDFFYTNSTPMPAPVGGFAAGTTFNNVSLYEMWTRLLYPDSQTTLAAFTNFVIQGINQEIEVGQGVPAGSYVTTWAIDNPQALQANSISIEYVNDNVTLASNLPNTVPINLNMPMITENNLGNLTFRISALNTSNTTFSRDFVVSVQDRIFVGESPLATLTENDVEALRINELKETIDGEYELLGGGYKWFCYPVSMGTRDNFYDVDTDFQIAMSTPQTITITNAYGVSIEYYCYRTYNVLNGAITIGIAE